MAALQANITLNLDANQLGGTVKIINDSLSLSGISMNQDTQLLETVNGGVSNQAVPLGGLTTASLVLLMSDQPVTVKFNGEATGHLCKNLLITDSAITAITLSNGGSTVATVRIYLLG